MIDNNHYGYYAIYVRSAHMCERCNQLAQFHYHAAIWGHRIAKAEVPVDFNTKLKSGCSVHTARN